MIAQVQYNSNKVACDIADIKSIYTAEEDNIRIMHQEVDDTISPD